MAVKTVDEIMAKVRERIGESMRRTNADNATGKNDGIRPANRDGQRGGKHRQYQLPQCLFFLGFVGFHIRSRRNNRSHQSDIYRCRDF